MIQGNIFATYTRKIKDLKLQCTTKHVNHPQPATLAKYPFTRNESF